MKIKGEKFIEIKDIMSMYQSQLDTYCINELGKVSMKIGVNVNEEQLKKWIAQAKLIEQFSVEDIIDGATRDLVYRTQQENQALKDRWQKLKKHIQEEFEIDKKFYEYDKADEYYKGCLDADENILNKMQALEEEIK